MKPALGSALSWEEECGARFGEANPGGQYPGNLRSLQIEMKLVVSDQGSIGSGSLSLGNSRLPLLLRLESCVPIENVPPAMSCPHFRASLDPRGWPGSKSALRSRSL